MLNFGWVLLLQTFETTFPHLLRQKRQKQFTTRWKRTRKRTNFRDFSGASSSKSKWQSQLRASAKLNISPRMPPSGPRRHPCHPIWGRYQNNDVTWYITVSLKHRNPFTNDSRNRTTLWHNTIWMKWWIIESDMLRLSCSHIISCNFILYGLYVTVYCIRLLPPPTTGCAPDSWNQVGRGGDFFKTYQRLFLPAMMRRWDGAKNWGPSIPFSYHSVKCNSDAILNSKSSW